MWIIPDGRLRPRRFFFLLQAVHVADHEEDREGDDDEIEHRVSAAKAVAPALEGVSTGKNWLGLGLGER